MNRVLIYLGARGLEVGGLTFPAWMYWQAVTVHVAIWVVLANTTSFFAVLLGSHRPQSVVIARILTGPLLTGALDMTIPIIWGAGWALIP